MNSEPTQEMEPAPIDPHQEETPINSEEYKVLSFTKSDYRTLERITKGVDELIKNRLVQQLKKKEVKIKSASDILESYILYTYHVAKYYGECVIVDMVYGIFEGLTFPQQEYQQKALFLYSKAVHYSYFINTYEKYEVSDIYSNYVALKDFVQYINDTSIAYHLRLNFKSQIVSFVKSIYLDIIKNYTTPLSAALGKDIDENLKNQIQAHIDSWKILKAMFSKELKTVFDNSKGMQLNMVCRVLQILIMITLKSTEWILQSKVLIKEISWESWLDSYIEEVETLVSKM